MTRLRYATPGEANFTCPRARGEVDRRSDSVAGRVRGRLHTAEPLGRVDTPPHPTLLPARGEKEQAAARSKSAIFMDGIA